MEAGLWGPALLLAGAPGGGPGGSGLADPRAFADVAAAMARAALLPGTPARTLALVLAGRWAASGLWLWDAVVNVTERSWLCLAGSCMPRRLVNAPAKPSSFRVTFVYQVLV